MVLVKALYCTPGQGQSAWRAPSQTTWMLGTCESLPLGVEDSYKSRFETMGLASGGSAAFAKSLQSNAQAHVRFRAMFGL